MTCKDCEQNKPVTIVDALDLDVDDLATLPDYFIGLRTLTDPTDGVVKAIPVRVPGEKVVPTGSLQNVVALTTNNTGLNVPENQVRAGYIDVQPGGNIMRYAGTGAPAMFLMVGAYGDGKMLVQSTGFLRLNGGHQYLVGRQYYLSTNGLPTTSSSTTGQKLFMPLDDYTLSINLDS